MKIVQNFCKIFYKNFVQNFTNLVKAKTKKKGMEPTSLDPTEGINSIPLTTRFSADLVGENKRPKGLDKTP